MVDQSAFQIALKHLWPERQKIEVIGVLEEFLSQFRLRGGERSLKVRQCRTLPAVNVTLNLMNEDVACPATLDCLPDIPFPFCRVLHHFKNSHIVSPGQLCNDLLHKLLVGVGFSESPHIFEVSRAKPSHPRKGLEKVMSQPIDDLCSPPFRLLASENVSADAPIEQYEFPIDG